MNIRPSFGVKYPNPDMCERMVEWDSVKKRWVRWWKEITGSRWYREPGIDELALEAIKEKFGLKELELPVLAEMSPAKLVKIRREFEERYGLPKLKILSDNFHYTTESTVSHYAEEYD